MASTDLAVRIATVLDATGLKKADKAFGNLDKQLKTLGRSLGLTLGTAAIVAYGKASVKAFAEDEAAATRLATTMDNLGLSMSKVQAADFISNLEKSASIADDVLRPAFQGLLNTTGSLTRSQELLNNAIQISRASGIDLATVANDLAKGYVGITKGLKKYNTGLTQAELSTKSFSEVLGILLTRSAGAADAYLETTSYKIDVLKVAAGNASETIGKGLVDAFAKMSGGTTASDAAKTIDNIAKAINGVTSAAGSAIGAVVKLYQKLGEVSKNISENYPDPFNLRDDKKMPAGRSSSPAGTAKRLKQQREAEAAATKRAKELAALQKKQVAAQKALTAEQKKQAALKKAGSIFDLEQIQIIAALKGNISKDEKLRLELQLALLQGNEDYAKKLSEQLALSQYKAEGLTYALNNLPKDINPFKAWITDLEVIEARIRALNLNPNGGTPTPSPSGNVPVMPIVSPDAVLARASADFAAANNQIRLIVEGGDEVTSLMRFKIQEAAQSGSTTNWSQTVGAWDR
jgi:hypothetical protein